ncbi:MAG: glycosyltransferase [Planctomycetota bacterium]|nr:glycosyltransferase [Planctomycetota bacterium]
MEALVVTRSIPGQERGMGRRGLELLRVLADAGYDIHLVSLVPPGQTPERARDLRGVCRWAHLFEHGVRKRLSAVMAYARHGSYLLARDWHAGMARKVAELLPQVQLAVCVDALFFDMIAAGSMGAGTLAPGKRPTMLLDLAEPMSQRMSTKARQVGPPASWVLHNEVLALRRLEVIAAQTADLTLVGNDIDLQMLGQRVKGGFLRMVADGVDLNEPPTLPQFAGLPDAIAFCGDLLTPAHQRSATWMAKEVMPLVRRERPSATLRLIGRGFRSSIRALAGRPGVELVDLNQGGMTMRLAMLQSVAGVAPHRQPRGAAEATMLALACGRPVVATQAAAMILPGETAVAPIRADKPGPVSEALVRLLTDRGHAFRTGKRSYELVDAHASWHAQWRRVGGMLVEFNPQARDTSDAPAPAARDATASESTPVCSQ